MDQLEHHTPLVIRSAPTLLLRVLLVNVLVLGLGHVYGRVLVDALLPLLAVIAEGVSDDYTAALMWDRADPDMLLIQAQFLNPAGGLSALGIHFGAQVEAGTHVQHALVPPVLVYVLLGVWPVTTVARRLRPRCAVIVGIDHAVFAGGQSRNLGPGLRGPLCDRTS